MVMKRMKWKKKKGMKKGIWKVCKIIKINQKLMNYKILMNLNLMTMNIIVISMK